MRLPLKNIRVTQPFGANYLNFYQQWGMKGHNGVDFEIKDGCPLHACHGGVVTFAKNYRDSGGKMMKHIEVWHDKLGIKTIYLHLKNIDVKEGQRVVAGQVIGSCDNTGTYSTGEHLHLGLKLTNAQGDTLNKDNGYSGAVDPTPYFNESYQGKPIKNKDCYENNAYHRYYLPNRDIRAEIKKIAELTKYLKRIPKNWEVNACLYGGWDKSYLTNPAMYILIAFITKGEYQKGITPFA